MVSTIVMRRLRLLKNAIETFMDSFRKAVDNDWKKYCSDFFPEIEVKKKRIAYWTRFEFIGTLKFTHSTSNFLLGVMSLQLWEL